METRRKATKRKAMGKSRMIIKFILMTLVVLKELAKPARDYPQRLFLAITAKILIANSFESWSQLEFLSGDDLGTDNILESLRTCVPPWPGIRVVLPTRSLTWAEYKVTLSQP